MGLGRYFKGAKRLVTGPHSIPRQVGDVGKNIYKYGFSPQHSILYGSGGPERKGWSLWGRQGVMGGFHQLAYFGGSVAGREEKTTLGAREVAQEQSQAEQETAKAEAAAKAAAVAAEQGTMTAYASELQRLRRKRGFLSTMYSGGAATGGGTTLGAGGSLG